MQTSHKTNSRVFFLLFVGFEALMESMYVAVQICPKPFFSAIFYDKVWAVMLVILCSLFSFI